MLNNIKVLSTMFSNLKYVSVIAFARIYEHFFIKLSLLLFAQVYKEANESTCRESSLEITIFSNILLGVDRWEIAMELYRLRRIRDFAPSWTRSLAAWYLFVQQVKKFIFIFRLNKNKQKNMHAVQTKIRWFINLFSTILLPWKVIGIK